MARNKNTLLVRLPSSAIKGIKHPLHMHPPVQLKNIQALLQKRGDCCLRLIDCWVENIHAGEIIEFSKQWPVDVIICHIDTFTIRENQEFANLSKKEHNPLLVGVGQGVLCAHNDFLEDYVNFDCLIPGESEMAVVNLFNELNQYSIEQVKVRYKVKYNDNDFTGSSSLNDIPSLIWEKEELDRYPFNYPLRMNKKVICGYVITSRGCPHQCIFCSPATRKSYGAKMHFSEPKKIANEIEDLVKLGVNFIAFDDDNFTVSKKHVVSICEEIKKRKLNINWATHARIDELNYSLLKLMKEAGCILLLLGVESGSRRIIDILKKNTKNIDWHRKTRDIFSEARKLGIATCALFIIGSPSETRQEVEESVRFVKTLKPDMIKVHFFTLYPGSRVYEQFKSCLNKENQSKMYHYAIPIVNISNMDIEELCKMQVSFYCNFLFDPRFLFSHLIRYLGFYIHNWRISYELLRKTFQFLFK